MDPSTMTFEEILFHGRYYIIGGVLFMIFFSVFIWEAFKEIRSEHAHRRSPVRRVAFGPLVHDDMLGQVMTDGGEPMDDPDESDSSRD